MFSFNTKQRLTQLELRLDDLETTLIEQNRHFCTAATETIKLLQTQINSKGLLEKDVAELKRQMELCLRAQCATYSAALERVQTLLEFEAKKNKEP